MEIPEITNPLQEPYVERQLIVVADDAVVKASREAAIPIAARILGAVTFLLGLFAAFFLYGTYFFKRIPLAISDFDQAHRDNDPHKTFGWMLIWVVVIWPIRIVFGRGVIGFQRFSEIGYILLYIGIVVIGSGSATFVIESLRKDLMK